MDQPPGGHAPGADGPRPGGQLRATTPVAVCHLRGRRHQRGDVHEAMNWPRLWRSRVSSSSENNQWALSTADGGAVRLRSPRRPRPGYGMPGEVVDATTCSPCGRRLVAVDGAVGVRDRRCSSANTFRMRGHEETSGTDYVPGELVERWATLDPSSGVEAVLDERGACTKAGVARCAPPCGPRSTSWWPAPCPPRLRSRPPTTRGGRRPGPGPSPAPLGSGARQRR